MAKIVRGDDRQKQFAENLKRLALFCPEAAAEIERHPNFPANVRLSLAGAQEVLEFYAEGNWHFCHSFIDPLGEAKNWCDSIDIDNCDLIYVYGLGLGYFAEPLSDWLKHPNRFLVFIEDNLDLLHAFLYSSRAKALLANSNIWIYYLGTASRLESFVEAFSWQKPKITSLPLYQTLFKDQCNNLHVKLTFIHNLEYVLSYEYRSFGVSFFQNFFRNLYFLPHAYLGDGLFGRFTNVPAVICGAGPSLAKNVHLLKGLRDRALIMAGATAINAVNAHGVVPHLGVGIDPNFEQITRVIMHQTYDVPFFYRGRMNHESLALVGGDRLYLSGTSGYGIGDYIDQKFGIEPSGLQEGCNVVNLCLAIAAKLGCNPIILVGVDLAYSEQQSYTSGITSHPIHPVRHLFRTKEHTEELLPHIDVNGQPVFTLWKWVTESLWFSSFANRHPEIQLINATEGGIGFNDIPNCTLETVIDQHLANSYDLSGRLFGAIQSSPMPTAARPNKISELLLELHDSLQACSRLTYEILSAAVESPVDLSAGPNGKLIEEKAYDCLLKCFNHNFDAQCKRDLWRLEIDALFHSSQEQKTRRNEIKKQRFTSLYQASRVIDEIIMATLDRQRYEEKLRANLPSGLTTAPPPAAGQYSYENGILMLIDPALGLNVVSTFSPSEEEIVQQRDRDGRLLSECFYHQGKLHGPSTVWGSKGELLMRTWYIHGKREGEVRQYYPSGALYGIQRYQQGALEGLQQRFYEDGKRRLEIHYHQGNLHGELYLWNSSGLLVRQLNFEEGQRHGLERIWNSWGQLMIEAEFNHGRPGRKARVWDDNGRLLEEFSYLPNGELEQVKRWDAAGAPLENLSGQPRDYFENVAVKTGVLTDNLTMVFDQMSALAPQLTQVNGRVGDFLADEYIEEIEKLKEELAKLQKIQHDMLFESGLDPKNSQEAIWKTPSLQRELELKLGIMTKRVSSDLAELQKSLHTAVERLQSSKSSSSNDEKVDHRV